MAVRERYRRSAQLTAGSILSKSFSIWFRNIIPFTILVLIVQLPAAVYTFFVLANPTVESLTQYQIILPLAMALLSFIATGAVTFGVVEQLGGKTAGIGRCLSVGISRLFPVLGVGIVASIAIASPLVLAGLLVGLGGAGSGPAVLILVPACAIPSVVLYCMYFAAVPAAVIERPGLFGALGRSMRLTRGAKGTIFLTLLVLVVVNWLAGKILAAAITVQSMADLPVFMWVTLAWSVVWGGLQATVPAVVYHDLRVAKEGVGIEDLKKVFA